MAATKRGRRMVYLIHAYEDLYGGLHGMETYCLTTCDSYLEAEADAINASLEVQQSYECIEEDLMSGFDNEDYERDYAEVLDDMMLENAAYEIYVVDTQGKDITELDKEVAEDPEGFIEKYCSQSDI